VGLHQPSDARHFGAAFVSVNRLAKRKSDFPVGDWIMDSGAFTEIANHGRYRTDVSAYAAQIDRWADCGNLIAAVAQDYMCEPWIVAKTGLPVPEHQRLTIDRYDALMALRPRAYIMPVLQGYAPTDYASHVRQYGDRLAHGAYVGVGSVCKRNSNPGSILAVLEAIKAVRPDLRLHGFGLKSIALACAPITALLESADSMAWSFRARKEGRNPNDWRESKAFERAVLAGSGRISGVQMEFAI
jgi:hypothetical protein